MARARTEGNGRAAVPVPPVELAEADAVSFNGHTVTAAPASVPTWRIVLGTHRDGAALLKSVTVRKGIVTDWAREILTDTALSIAPVEVEVEVMALTLAELRVKKPLYRLICRSGQRLGYRLCPPEGVVALRLAYADQPKGECIVAAMRAIPDAEGNPCVLALNHIAGRRLLTVCSGAPETVWPDHYRFLFLRRPA